MTAIIPGASPVGGCSKGSVGTVIVKSNGIGVLQLNPNSFWEHHLESKLFPMVNILG